MARKQNFLALCLPYCLERVDDDRWVALNRAGKPVGFTGKNYVVNFSTVAHAFALTPEILKQLGAKKGARKIYLYDRKADPVEDAADFERYLGALEILAGVTARHPG